MPVTIGSLIGLAPGARPLGDPSIEVTEVCADSRAVVPGTLFACIPGSRADGHDHAPAAVAAGATGLLVERPLDLPVPQIVVPSVRAAVGAIASRVLGDPSRAMTLIGVTGTNGKTTTSFMLESVIKAMGMSAGLVGTVETHLGATVEPVTRTTPEAPDLQRLLARMRDAGVAAAAMEVSSHGLDLGRVAGTWYEAAIFTNLTQDHLDWHGTMEAYFESKATLFTPEMAARAVINAGDPWGARLVERTPLPVTTFALDGGSDVVAAFVTGDASGSTVDVRVPDGVLRGVRVPIAGAYNVTNALGVIACGVALGWPLEQVVGGIEATPGVPGRMESVDAGQDFAVLVDYAHTPDSLDNVLRAARELTPAGARLVVVFGCGGDRDTAKRAPMGRIGAALADRCIITSDNPRTEDPDAIVAMIAQGARETGRDFEVVVDRRAAIEAAVAGASAGDVVVIAGKGHETYQEFADTTIHFDDREVARAALEGR